MVRFVSNLRSLNFTTDLWRGLHREHISVAVLVVKLILVVYGITFAALAINQLIGDLLSVSTKSVAISSQVQQALVANRSPINIPPPPPDYFSISRSEMFGTLQAPTPTPPPAQKPPAAPKSPLTLVGTFATTRGKPSAIIENPKAGMQEVFDLGDMVFGEAKLIAIRPNEIDLLREGQTETLELEGGSSGGPADGTQVASVTGNIQEIVIPETDVDNALSNLPLVMTQVRAVPYFKEGKAIGLRLFAIKAGSIFEKAQLKSGDILKSVDGNSLDDFSQALKLFEKLKNQRQVTVLLERNREDKELRYVKR